MKRSLQEASIRGHVRENGYLAQRVTGDGEVEKNEPYWVVYFGGRMPGLEEGLDKVR